MPQFGLSFTQRVREALSLVEGAELARNQAEPGTPVRRAFHAYRLEFLYEIAFLRVFTAWETFLEETFYRYLCGCFCRGVQAPLAAAQYYSTNLADAESRVLGGGQFVLWHNPAKVIQRSARFFKLGPHEAVVGSYQTQLDYLASIRHRIAHEHMNAKVNFNNASVQLSGRRYRGARAGSFLRDFNTTKTPVERWLVTLSTDLASVAGQLA